MTSMRPTFLSITNLGRSCGPPSVSLSARNSLTHANFFSHIDYGDTFDTAVERKKFPEKVPFRLTRQLVNALGVGGVDGLYFEACKVALHNLRAFQGSVMIMLQAFVHDPVTAWRLVSRRRPRKEDKISQKPLPGHTVTTAAVSEQDGKHDNGGATGPLGPQSGDSQSGMGGSQSRSANITASTTESSGRTEDDSAVLTDEETEQLIRRKAIKAMQKVQAKLGGKDFGPVRLTIDQQIQRLIEQATSNDNLAQMYLGFCPFW